MSRALWTARLLAALLMLGVVLAARAQDPASLRRGEQMFMDDCAACHSLKYLRHDRIRRDLGLSAAEAERDLERFGVRAESPVMAPMTPLIAGFAFGKMPPDLSLEVSVRGRDWVRRYLDGFYLDPSSPRGWNNAVLADVAMPDPFWRSQGIRGGAHGRPGAWLVPGQLKPAQFEARLDELVDFLQYASAPDVVQRRAVGPWVLLFLAVFTALAFALKRALWKDVSSTDSA